MTESMLTESLGIMANVLRNLAFVPQIIKSYRCKQVEGVSIMMFATLFVTQICWIAYAIPLHAKELYTSSMIEIVLLIPIFVMYLKYRKPPESTPLASNAREFRSPTRCPTSY